MFELRTPILFLLFNRPDTTQKVFNEIRKAKPKQLFVAADGPRENEENDIEKCRATKDIINQVDWDCEVKTLFREKNLGLKIGISSAIDWFFENVEEGIILEHDCVPHPTFFQFCQELLEKYREDERIFVITGDNFLFGHKRTDYSYYFSRYVHCWGWATWRRAWLHYDGEIKIWPEIKNGNWLKDVVGSAGAVRWWSNRFQHAYENKIAAWDYLWVFSCWMQNGLTITPNVNLISNIGFGPEATHTKSKSRIMNMETTAMDLPLRHPPFVIIDTQADNLVQRTHHCYISNIFLRIIKKFLIKRLVNRILRKLKKDESR